MESGAGDLFEARRLQGDAGGWGDRGGGGPRPIKKKAAALSEAHSPRLSAADPHLYICARPPAPLRAAV